MFLFRILGLLLITLALMALGSDALRSLEAGKVEIRSLAELWALLSQTSLDSFLAWVAAHAASVSGPLATVFSYPAWAVLGVVGIVIAGLIRVTR
jgi:hypothetical protein